MIDRVEREPMARASVRGRIQPEQTEQNDRARNDRERLASQLNDRRPDRVEYARSPLPDSSSRTQAVDRELRDRTSPQTVSKNTLVSGLVMGAAGTALTVAMAPGIVAAAPIALALPFVQSVFAGGSTYLAGEVHNMVWHTDGAKRPGGIGTFLRGIVSPITVPVGLLRNILWNKKAATA